MSVIRSAVRKVRTLLYRIMPGSFPIDAWSDERYDAWFKSQGRIPASAACDEGTKFSVIVPLYRTPKKYFEEMSQSVLGQTYKNLELVLVNASPDVPEIAKWVNDLKDLDERVKVVQLEENYGITENTSRGIDVATGDFICFVDHDDFIEHEALLKYACAISADPSIDILYCDEDMVEDRNGGFFHKHPLFKPAYSPELLLSKNYVMHLMAIRKRLIDDMPRPAEVFDGSQDYNMLLTVSGNARKVHHIPEVLYHWRISENSTATNPESKPYSKRSSRLALSAHLQRNLIPATICGSGIDNLHNLWFETPKNVKVSVVADMTSKGAVFDVFCEQFELSCTFPDVEIVGVSRDEVEVFRGGTSTHLSLNKSVSSRYEAFNRGAEQSVGDHVVFVDGRTDFSTPQALEQMAGLLLVSGVGVVGPKVVYTDGIIKYYGIAITKDSILPLSRGYEDSLPGYLCVTRAFQNCSATSSEGMMTRKDLFLALGGFDERYSGEAAAADYCQKVIQAGYRVAQTPTATVTVGERCPRGRFSAQTARDGFIEADLELFDQKWPGVREKGDPYYSRNLRQDDGFCRIKRFGCLDKILSSRTRAT